MKPETLHETRHIDDGERESIFVYEDGKHLRFGRKSAASEALCLEKRVLEGGNSLDDNIRMAMWCYEAGFKQGEEHGRWFVAREIRKLLRVPLL